ncbi:MAG: F5/8 type C domain protein [Lentisphaerae bacterium ADurb.BinA184]|nr:MAG: F5/8 type C domain protein [Lentisphaerae bacterium ADurb.BinA184]
MTAILKRVAVVAAVAATQLTAVAVKFDYPFPLDANGAYTANVMREYNAGAGTTKPVVGGATGPGVSLEYSLLNSVDGAGEKTQWNGGTANDPTKYATVQYTLADTYLIKEFNHSYLGGNTTPTSYQISVSTTGFGAMTPVVSGGTPGTNQWDVLTTPVAAKYIEYRWQGTNPSYQYIMLQEFRAYADGANLPAITTTAGFDVVAMRASGPVTATKVSGNWQYDSENNIIDLDQFTYLRGAGGGDALVVVDLGKTHAVQAFSLGFYQGQTWGSGARIELSEDGASYTSVFSQTTSLGSAKEVYLASPVDARYVRLTNYGGSNGALSDFQVFGVAIPEPASASLLLLSAAGLLRPRRG